ncbi:hypothetical protein [Bradyrhizobium sp. WSM1253]|uniref:hypothetical protein n=1 Tax=Bradyrhizobium sp. WSM1253 TaxID=319003 RepID=UPI0012F4B350|nr:hypothetical protein [Bradyrhizobium sp. WSM1253]
MRGKDEMTGIGTAVSTDSQEMSPVTKRRRENRGIPPPVTFDIDTLPGSANYTALRAPPSVLQRDLIHRQLLPHH